MQQAAVVRAAGASSSVSLATAGHNWSVGQVLSARVMDAGAGGTALLRVGSEQVQANTQLDLEPGQTLRLRVESAGPPALLRVVDDDAVRNPEALAARVLRGALPEQRPLAESLAALQRLSTMPPPPRGSDLPDVVRSMLSDLMASLPRPQDVADPARLAAMVRSCGLFHEAEQARADAQGARPPGSQADSVPAAADLKARIAAVADALQQGAGERAREGTAREAEVALRGALARIETNQVLSARASSEQAALWRVDLPVADEQAPHGVELRIRRDGARGGDSAEEQPSWVVELMVEPPGQVPLHARVTLSGGSVYTLFTTEDEALFEHLDARSGELARRLCEMSLAVGGVRCRCAPLPQDDVSSTLRGLLHEKA